MVLIWVCRCSSTRFSGAVSCRPLCWMRMMLTGCSCRSLPSKVSVSLASTRSHMPSLTVPPSTLASFSSMYFRTDTEPCSSVMSKLRHHWPGLRRW